MLKFLKPLVIALAFAPVIPAAAQDVAKGAKVFKKCRACHAVGEGAKHKVGPELNDLFGRIAGGADGYKYSKAMKASGQDGLVWDSASLDEFLTKPKKMIKKTKMAFAGLKKKQQRDDLIAYLNTFSAEQETKETNDASRQQENAELHAKGKEENIASNAKEQVTALIDQTVPAHGVFHLGRKALVEEVAAWDIDVRPDGAGLPEGKGTVAEGEVLYADNCAVCHGDFGEGIDRWPVLAGGQDTLTDDRPVKTVGSYWPYLSTVYDYVRRAMPFGDARSLSDDDVYALTAYLLYLNDIVTEEDFELSKNNFAQTKLPNESNFISDNRVKEPFKATSAEPCMTNCKPDAVTVTMRARVIDVTPDSEDSENPGALD